MRGTSETRWISIRLANGKHYTVFERGNWGSQRLLLTPALENQDKANIEFYYHTQDVSNPVRIGVIKLAKLPTGEVELSLEAELTSEGTLSVTVRHEASGKEENLRMQIPDDGVQRSPSGQNSRLQGGMRWFLGILFVILGLAIVLWLVQLVTDWGEQETLPPPISRTAIELTIT